MDAAVDATVDATVVAGATTAVACRWGQRDGRGGGGGRCSRRAVAAVASVATGGGTVGTAGTAAGTAGTAASCATASECIPDKVAERLVFYFLWIRAWSRAAGSLSVACQTRCLPALVCTFMLRIDNPLPNSCRT